MTLYSNYTIQYLCLDICEFYIDYLYMYIVVNYMHVTLIDQTQNEMRRVCVSDCKLLHVDFW